MKNNKMPFGIIVILGLFVYEALFSLITVNNPGVVIGPFVVQGLQAYMICALEIAALALMFYGLLKRFNWTALLAIVSHLFLIGLAIINLVSFFADNDLTSSLMPGAVYSWVIYLAVIVFIFDNKDYFSDRRSK
jgi:hypothetical protein